MIYVLCDSAGHFDLEIRFWSRRLGIEQYLFVHVVTFLDLGQIPDRASVLLCPMWSLSNEPVRTSVETVRYFASDVDSHSAIVRGILRDKRCVLVNL